MELKLERTNAAHRQELQARDAERKSLTRQVCVLAPCPNICLERTLHVTHLQACSQQTSYCKQAQRDAAGREAAALSAARAAEQSAHAAEVREVHVARTDGMES